MYLIGKLYISLLKRRQQNHSKPYIMINFLFCIIKERNTFQLRFSISYFVFDFHCTNSFEANITFLSDTNSQLEERRKQNEETRNEK